MCLSWMLRGERLRRIPQGCGEGVPGSKGQLTEQRLWDLSGSVSFISSTPPYTHTHASYVWPVWKTEVRLQSFL